MAVGIEYSVNPNGSGDVSAESTILRPGTSQQSTKWTLTATPRIGWQFDNFTYTYKGTGSPSYSPSSTTDNPAIWIYIDANASGTGRYVANFSKIKYTITTKSSPAEGGTASPASINVVLGSSVSISATPKSGYEFDYWECNGQMITRDNPYSFTFYEDSIRDSRFVYTAVFKKIQKYKISTTIKRGKGSVSGAGEYEKDKQCTLKATANAQYVFLKYVDKYGTTYKVNPLTFTVDSDNTFNVYFKPKATGEILCSTNGIILYGKKGTILYLGD